MARAPSRHGSLAFFKPLFLRLLGVNQNDGNVEAVCREQIADKKMKVASVLRRFRRWRRQREFPAQVRDGRALLTPAEEKSLLGVVMAFAVTNVSCHRSELIKLVRSFVPHDHQVSANADSQFLRRFLAKHRGVITVKRDKLMAKARVSSRLLSDVDRFIEAFCVIREKYNIADAGLITCDETLLVVHGTDVGDNRVELVRRGQKSVEAPRARRLGSLLLFVSATGHVLLRIFILKPYRLRGNVDSVVIPRPRRYRNHDLYYMTTKSGVVIHWRQAGGCVYDANALADAGVPLDEFGELPAQLVGK